MTTFKANDVILMWIDGSPMPGVVARRSGPVDGITTLRFDWDERLPSLQNSKESWLRVLRHPFRKQTFEVSAGVLAGPPLPTKIQQFPIRRVSKWGLFLWSVFFVVTVWGIWKADRKINLLREDEGSYTNNGRRAFSLARTQMTFWTFLIAMSLAYIWLVTWNEDVVNPSVLLLLGIATGTTLGAIVVDNSKKDEALKTLAAAGAPAPAVPVLPPAPGIQSVAVAEATKVLTTPTNETFLLDLISDRNGPSIARVQMLLFTLILMVIFVVETFRTLVMPEFSPTLLGLMGISSAGYVALKIPERKS